MPTLFLVLPRNRSAFSFSDSSLNVIAKALRGGTRDE